MKLTFRDLKQQKFVIEAEPSETVGQVKEKISQEKGWEASQQKLIYSGKILQDDNTIESYNIEEKGFIVCMVSKPKAAPASAAATSSKAPSTPAAAPASTPAAPAAPAAPATPSAPATQAPETPTPAGAGGEGSAFGDPSAFAMGAQSEGVVSQMEAMGFERPDIERAMRAAFFNPDRAIDYLLNGIPEHIQQEQQQRRQEAAAGQQQQQQPATASETPATAPTAAPSNPATTTSESDEPVNLFEAAAAQAGGGGQGGGARGSARSARGAAQGLAGATAGGEGGAAGGTTDLEFLRNNPHFQQLRQLVQQQPQMLEPILQQVGAGNPQLAQLIGQNQEQFLQLLSEDIEDDSQLPPGTQTISVTEEERDAIERLCRLGFPRDSVIQAYFACDKNEELAANFLFEQPDENEEGS